MTNRWSRSLRGTVVGSLLFSLAVALAANAVPPAITTQPESQVATNGATVTLTVAATGTPPLSFQWKKDELDLAGRTNTNLILANVSTNDAGNYSVTVGNAESSVTSSNATLTVQPLTGQFIVFDLRSAHGHLESFELDPTVQIDVSKDEGDVLLMNGSTAGYYKFYNLVSQGTNRGSILKIMFLTGGWNSAGLNGHAHLYVSSFDRADFTFFGHSEFFPNQELDLTKPFYQLLHRLIFDVKALSRDDILVLAQGQNLDTPLMQASSFANTYYPFLFSRLADICAMDSRPNLFTGESPSADSSPIYIASYANGRMISRIQLENCAMKLEQVWQRLGFGAKSALLHFFPHGSSRAMDIIARLKIDFVNFLDPASIEYGSVRAEHFGQLSVSLRDLPQHLGIERTQQRDLIRRFLSGWRELSSWPFYQQSGAIAEILGQIATGDGISYDLSEHEAEMRLLVDRLLLTPVGQPDQMFWVVTDHIFTGLAPYLSGSAKAQIDAAFLELLSNREPEPFYVYRAIRLLRPPISNESRIVLENFVATRDFSQLSFDQWWMLKYLTAEDMDRLPVASQEKIFSTLAGMLRQKFGERAQNEDTWGEPWDWRLYDLIRLVKGSSAFPSFANHVTSVLQTIAPKQSMESEVEYGARLGRIEWLWLQDRIVLFDLSGGSYVRPGYIEVISDFNKNHPNWLHVCALSTRQYGHAYSGVAQGNWRDNFTTPYLLADLLLHEGGHTLQSLLDEPAYRRVNIIPSHWYYNYLSAGVEGTNNFVTSYAMFNPKEFWAENTYYWYLDSKTGLKRALEGYKNGYPVMLNMFLFIGTLTKPLDAPAGDLMPLFTLKEDGFLDREYIPARWTRGDMKDGEFEFTFEDKVYTVYYRHFKIGTVLESGQILKEVLLAPELVSKGEVSVEELAFLSVTNSVLGSELSQRKLTFTMLAGPAGMAVDPEKGIVTWVPSELQGGTTNLVQIEVISGETSLSDTNTFKVIVKEVNTAPFLDAIANQSISELTTLMITNIAGDFDLPAQNLTFSLDTAPPTATINSTNGVVTWTPTETNGSITHTISVKVTDDGSPPLSATNSILIVVRSRPSQPPKLTAVLSANGTVALNLIGEVDLRYFIETSQDLETWQTLTNMVPAAPSIQFTDPAAQTLRQRFYRAVQR